MRIARLVGAVEHVMLAEAMAIWMKVLISDEDVRQNHVRN